MPIIDRFRHESLQDREAIVIFGKADTIDDAIQWGAFEETESEIPASPASAAAGFRRNATAMRDA